MSDLPSHKQPDSGLMMPESEQNDQDGTHPHLLPQEAKEVINQLKVKYENSLNQMMNKVNTKLQEMKKQSEKKRKDECSTKSIFDISLCNLYEKQALELEKSEQENRKMKRKINQFNYALKMNNQKEEEVRQLKQNQEQQREQILVYQKKTEKLQQDLREKIQKQEVSQSTIRQHAQRIKQQQQIIQSLKANQQEKRKNQESSKEVIIKYLKGNHFRTSHKSIDRQYDSTKYDNQIKKLEDLKLKELVTKMVGILYEDLELFKSISQLSVITTNQQIYDIREAKSFEAIKNLKPQSVQNKSLWQSKASLTAVRLVEMLNSLMNNQQNLKQQLEQLQNVKEQLNIMKKSVEYLAQQSIQYSNKVTPMIIPLRNQKIDDSVIQTMRNLNKRYAETLETEKQLKDKLIKIQEQLKQQKCSKKAIEEKLEKQIQQLKMNQRNIRESLNVQITKLGKDLAKQTNQHQLTKKSSEKQEQKTKQLQKLLQEKQTIIKQLKQHSQKKNKEYEQKIRSNTNTIANYQMDLKNRKDQYDDLVTEKERYECQIDHFLAQISTTVNQLLEIDTIKLSSNHIQHSIDVLRIEIQTKVNAPKYLVESKIFKQLGKDTQLYLEKQLTGLLSKKIIKSKTLYECDPNCNNMEWMKIIQNHPNLLMLLKMTNGYLIAGFSHEPYCPEIKRQGKGFISSLTNKKKYKLKLRQDASILKHTPYYFTFGSDEIVVKKNGIVTSLFGRAQTYFDSKGDKLEALFGDNQREMKYELLQFHELTFQ